jgi:ABC-type amino acid transport/signal transduction systems, periplasmic component/domain
MKLFDRFHSTICLMLMVASGVLGTSGAARGECLVAFIPDTNWPPYLIEDSGGKLSGLLPDLLQEVLNPLGFEVKLLRLPNKRGWVMLDSGEVDLHLKAREWVPNAEDYLWSDPLFDSEDVLLYSRERPIRFDTLEDLVGLRIAVVNSFVYPGLDEMFAAGEADRVPLDSPFAMLDLVAMGRADAAVVNRAETLWLFRNRPELHGKRFALTDVATDISPYRFVFTKQKSWAPLLEKINQELAAMKADGRLDEILHRYR